MSGSFDHTLRSRLSDAEVAAAEHFIWRVLNEVPARLREAALFGSRARGDGGPQSDIDILLVFEQLPWDREPAAGIAERIADEVAHRSAVPIGSWSVSLADLHAGDRTPMLVDALEDKVTLWCWPDPLPAVAFTPIDAIRCCEALLERLGEGSDVFGRAMERGDLQGALRRVRDDLVRAGTGVLLLQGVTRPRRADVPAAILERREKFGLPPYAVESLRWCQQSFGPQGKDEDRWLATGSLPVGDLVRTVELLSSRILDIGRQMGAGGGEPISATQFIH